MASIERTAYPRLKKKFTDKEVINFYTPTESEVYFVKNQSKGDSAQLHLLILLKVFQKLNYFPKIQDIPEEIIYHLSSVLEIDRQISLDVSPRTLYRHQLQVRRLMQVSSFDGKGRKYLNRAVLSASMTMDNPADLINVGVEKLIKENYELPAYRTLELTVRRYRNFVNQRIFNRIYKRLDSGELAQLLHLLEIDKLSSKTPYNGIKDIPKRPTLTHLKQLLEHLDWLVSFGNMRGKLHDIPLLKIKHFAALAKTLDAGELKDFVPSKRVSLIICLIYQTQLKTRDSIAEMFIKRMMKFHQLAKEKLQALQIAQRAKTEHLLNVFSNVLLTVKNTESAQIIGENVKNICDTYDLEKLIEDCETTVAAHSDNYLPFLWKFYYSHRKTLHRLVRTLTFISTTQDQTLMNALDLLLEIEDLRGDYIFPTVDLTFTTEKWKQVIVKTVSGQAMYERKHFEVCVFSYLMSELKSGDIAIEFSNEYADYRQQLLSWAECEPMVQKYCQEVELPDTAKGLIFALKEELGKTGDEVDKNFSRNSAFTFDDKGILSLKRRERQEVSASHRDLEIILQERMPERHLLDILSKVQHYTNMTRHFGPLSGSDPKIRKPIERYLLTIFTFGCNLGPSQAAQHMRGVVTPHMLGFVNKRHINAEKLDQASEAILNKYYQFSLPHYWGDGSRVAADGTKYELSEQNLMAEYHIRYGGYGGIAYYHVSDTYIAIFSHFISCGTWEAVYILDGLLKNKSDIQPDTIHADTQGQSTPVFGLSYMLGIKLQPRIRNIKDLIFYRLDKSKRYKHIDQLFGEAINWELIETHWQDLMQVVLSIKAGKVLPSTLLRKLSNYSRRNRLYQAYRELGRVIRTIYLLNYISDQEMREEVHAQTNKAESFNNFVKWIYFGGEATIWDNDPEEQEKAIKYNTLIADAVVFQNVIDMTKVFQEMINEGIEIKKEDLIALSPYQTKNIKRFGEYVVDLSKIPSPLNFDSLFSL